MEKGIIYKYPLTIGEVTQIELPESAAFLSVKNQGTSLVAYFLIAVEPKEEKQSLELYKFLTVMTGEPFGIEMGMSYVDTFMMENGDFMVHVFGYE